MKNRSSLHVDLSNTGSFSVNSKVMGLIGPSGSGKTTLIEQIAGLRDGAIGNIILNDQILLDSEKEISVPANERSIGFMFQDKLLFPHLTIAENIWFSAKMRGHSTNIMQELTQELHLDHLMNRYPHQISGGEKQRVCLARAINSNPKLLILDEPTSGLDPSLRENILAMLRRMIKYIECPILMVTHYIDDVIALCDTLTVMSNGKIISSGPLSEVLSKPDVHPFLGYREVITEIEGQTTKGNAGILNLNVGNVIFKLEDDHLNDKYRRIRIRARDVAVALKEPSHTSMQNIIPGIISAIDNHGQQEALVSIKLGQDGQGPEIKSLITMRSKKDLQLGTGLLIFVMIKAVAMQSPS